MPVTPNIARVVAPVASACPASLTNRSYLVLGELGGNLVAHRYVDGSWQETLRTQAPEDFKNPGLSGAWRAHALGNSVVFRAWTPDGSISGGINRLIVTWDIDAGTYAIIDALIDGTDGPVPVGATDLLWAGRYTGGVDSWIAPVGETIPDVLVPTYYVGSLESPPEGNYVWGSGIQAMSGKRLMPGAAPGAPAGEAGVLSLLPSGPEDEVSGLHEDHALGLSVGLPVTGGSVVLSSVDTEGAFAEEVGRITTAGVWEPWTPASWGAAGAFGPPAASPSGAEWSALWFDFGEFTPHVMRFALAVIPSECPPAPIPMEEPPDGSSVEALLPMDH